MEYFVGLDVSLETVNVCIVNAAGDILLEKKIAAEPAAIVHLLKGFGSPFKRIGLEAGPTSSWLYGELRAAGYGAICLECRHVKAGRPILLNPSCPPTPTGVEHAKKPEPFRALPTWPAENNGVDNPCPPKEPAISQIEVDNRVTEKSQKNRDILLH